MTNNERKQVYQLLSHVEVLLTNQAHFDDATYKKLFDMTKEEARENLIDNLWQWKQEYKQSTVVEDAKEMLRQKYTDK